jgi:aryl-alcohol dehydrogenase
LTFGSCGVCRACAEGEPAYCHDLQRLQFGGERADASASYVAGDGRLVHGAFFQQSSFATHALATERNAVKIPDEMPLELAGIFGCGVQTGAGAVFNTLAVRPLSSIAVFGAGTVGLAAIMAARIAGCSEIIAVDVVAHRLDLARELGATRTIDAREGDSALLVKEFTRGGAMYSLETAGAVESFNAAIECLAFRGVCGIVTVPNHGQPFPFTPLPILFGRRLVGVLEGSSVPQQFIPRLMQLHLEGRLPVERLVQFYAFDDIADAFADAQAGQVIKPILRMDD